MICCGNIDTISPKINEDHLTIDVSSLNMNAVDAENLWKTSSVFSEYKFIEQIGKGSFSDVWKAQHIFNKTIVAIKVAKTSPFASDILVKEFVALKKFDSKFIVSPDCFFYGRNNCVFMILPLYHNDLFSIVDESERLDERALQNIVRDIGAAIQLIHAKNFVHRDVKPENIFVTIGNTCVLGDFGSVEHEDVMTLSSLVGTSSYIAPEVVLAASRPSEGSFNVGKPSDIYGLGQTLYMAATRSNAIPHTNNLRKLAAIIPELDMMSLVDDLDRSYDFKSLLRGMLDPHPVQRLTIGEIMKHPFTRRMFL
jgi:serine/threonine protein kinase